MTAALDHDIEAEDTDVVVERSAGQIVSVTAAPVAASLVADATAGATLLEVDDAAIFDEIAGGTVQLGGNTYTYQGAGIDTAADTVTVDTGLAADASEGDQVTAWDDANNDAYRIWEADVAVPGAQDNDEPVAAVVSQSLTVQIAQGTRDITPGETITMELTGTTWTIIDAPGTKSQVQPDAGGQNVITGTQDAPSNTSITSTLAGDGTSFVQNAFNGIAIGTGATARAILPATADDAIAVGHNASALAYRSLAVGDGATASGDHSSAFGEGATAEANNAIAVGVDSDASGGTSVAVGYIAQATDTSAVAVGRLASASAVDTIAIGDGCSADTHDAIAIGDGAYGGGASAVAIGNAATVNGVDYGVALGVQARVTATDGIAIGDTAKAEDTNALAVGRLADSACVKGVALGDSAQVVSSSDNAVAIGPNASAVVAKYGIALGNGVEVNGDGSVAIGCDHAGTPAGTSAQDEFALGTSLHKVLIAGRLNVARHTPTSTADTQGSVGDITSDDSYVYVKTSTGWKRAALSTF